MVKNAFDAAEADEEAKAQQQVLRSCKPGLGSAPIAIQRPTRQVQNQATMAADLREMFQAIAIRLRSSCGHVATM